MRLDNIHTIYLLGIGGIGMSGLARYFAAHGYRVLGYDRTPSPLTRSLEKEGIAIQYDDSLALVETLSRNNTLVVRTPAVPENFTLYKWLIDNGFTLHKRAEVLGWLCDGKKVLAVAGTHGKTTTSTMLAHLLHGSSLGVNAFLGGVSSNYQTNLLIDKRSEYLVVEADEYDRSFLHLHPSISVITSMDPDHLDIYHTEEAYVEGFVAYASQVTDIVVAKAGLPIKEELLNAKLYHYAVDAKADFYADNIRIANGELQFDFHTPDGTDICDIMLGVPVRVNVENSVAALAVAYLLGIEEDCLRKGIATFAGVHRRFEQHIRQENLVYIDDYAHHPEELRASISSIRALYPQHILIGIFQPHLYSRTRDLAPDFAKALSELDEIMLLPIYPARELPIEGVTSEWLLTMIERGNSSRVLQGDTLVSTVETVVEKHLAAGDSCAIVTLGAGDIVDYCDRLKQTLTNITTHK